MNIICFCHLRWNFVYQRPQHLLGRFASKFNVYVVEEPVFDTTTAFLDANLSKEKVWVLVPHLSASLNGEEQLTELRSLLSRYFEEKKLDRYIAWYYTPMALPLGEVLPPPELVVYDCMDELSAFKNAPVLLKEREVQLLKIADLVFTGGHSLYEAKKDLHPDVHAFPSSIDKVHFGKARTLATDPPDQSGVPRPRIGFFGVIDERMNMELLGAMAEARPDWQFILIGPVVKIDPATLPQAPNLHYFGGRSYEELPAYLSGWDVAMIPFALNESTRFISPTKTPEYLAGGIPVVSSPLKDVVSPYGEKELVYIAGTPDEFVNGIEWAIRIRDKPAWKNEVDDFLAGISWDETWNRMMHHIQLKLEGKHSGNLIKKENEYV